MDADVTPIDVPDSRTLSVPEAALPREGETSTFTSGNMQILVCRSKGRLFAVEDRCPHRNLPLGGGRIRHGHIFCPHHGARFALATGAPAGPAAAALRVFPCRLDQSGLVISLRENDEGQNTR